MIMNQIVTNGIASVNDNPAAAAGLNGTVFNGLDVAVILCFIVGMIATVWYSMRKKNESGKDYFLSGRDANWLQIGSSIFSSNIGSEHLVGLAGAGFATGMAMAHWEMQGWMILILGWVFVPLYDRMKVFTMPEFLELRFSRGSRNVLSLLTMDFFREWYPNASGKMEVVVGRIATAVIVFVGICWVLVIKSLHSNLYSYLQNVQGYLSPAIAVLFIGGVFWKRATAPAALWAFSIGVIGGFAKLAADLVMRNDSDNVTKLKDNLYHRTITLDQYNAAIAPIKAKFGLIFDFWNFHQWYYCEVLFVLTAVLMIVISLMTAPPDAKTIKYTWYGATPQEKTATRASWGTLDVVLSLIVVACAVLFYIKFW
jgi:Na+/proline symporter